MKNPDEKPTTLEERLIGAFISAIAMACTIAGLSFIFFIIFSKGRYAGTQVFINFVFSEVSLLIIAFAAVLGFFLKFDLMVNIFSSLWGTNSAETDSTGKSMIVIALAVATLVAVLLFRQ